MQKRKEVFYMTLDMYQIIYIVLGVCAIFYVTMFFLLKRHKNNKRVERTGVEEKGGVRYTVEDAPVVKRDTETQELEANVTYEKKDIVLRRGFKYVVGDNNKIKPGKYTLLTSEEGINEFNIRRNGYVRSYEHNSGVVLSPGDELTPVNISVILR